MKILVVADEESTYLWDYYDEKLFKDIDLIISAGDLKAKYLSFLTTLSGIPVCYVPGNHDYRYENQPPYGCDNIDDQIYVHNNIRILGLGGSYRYKQGPYQYSEKEMQRRIRRLKNMIRQFGGVDILVTHAPALGHGDGDDLCHRGFDAFNKFIYTYSPSYFIHGHQHLTYSRSIKRVSKIDNTNVINGYNYYLFEYETNNKQLNEMNFFQKLLNSLVFYFKYFKTPVMKNYRAYKKYLKKNQ
jgi:Icc-related predicted phosphoesterase